jgi:hypothetical protein
LGTVVRILPILMLTTDTSDLRIRKKLAHTKLPPRHRLGNKQKKQIEFNQLQ